MRRRGAASVLAVLLAALLAVPPSPAAAAAAAPPAVPGEVSAWFATEAPAQVRAAAAGILELPPGGTLDDLAIGPPRVVHLWAEDYLTGDSTDPVALPVDEWVAPIVLQSSDEPEPMGTVRAWRDPTQSDEVTLAQVDGDAELARTLLERPAGIPFIFDGPVQGWFTTADGEVWPLTEGAEELLVGAVPVELFQPILRERYEAGQDDPDGSGGGGPGGEDGRTPLVPVVVVLVLLLAVAAGLLLVRQQRRGGSPPGDGG